MSLEDQKQEESEKHTRESNCPVCKDNKERFGSTAKVCFESSSKQAGEDTKRF